MNYDVRHSGKCWLATYPARTLMPTHRPLDAAISTRSSLRSGSDGGSNETNVDHRCARAVGRLEHHRAAAERTDTGCGEYRQAVQQQDQERIRAQIAADTIALRRIYADDFLGIGPTGVVRNKAEVIADFTTHALTYQSITTAEVRVRVYGNTAVETGRSTMVGQDKGKDVPRENRFTRVWVVTDGRWQLVANHYSLMTTQWETSGREVTVELIIGFAARR